MNNNLTKNNCSSNATLLAKSKKNRQLYINNLTAFCQQVAIAFQIVKEAEEKKTNC